MNPHGWREAARRALLPGDGQAAEAALAAGLRQESLRLDPGRPAAGPGAAVAAEIYLILAGLCRLTQRWHGCAHWAGAALAALDPGSSELLVWAHLERGAAATHLGDVRLGRRHLLACLAKSRGAGEWLALRPLAWSCLGHGWLSQRRPARAAAALAAAGAAYLRLGQPEEAAGACCLAAWAAGQAGDGRRAARWLGQAEAWLTVSPPRALALVAHAQVLRLEGKAHEALAACRQVLTGQAAGASPREMAMAGWLAAEMLLERGAAAEAPLAARTACAQGVAAGFPLLVSGAQATLARALTAPRPYRGRRIHHG